MTPFAFVFITVTRLTAMNTKAEGFYHAETLKRQTERRIQ